MVGFGSMCKFELILANQSSFGEMRKIKKMFLNSINMNGLLISLAYSP
jgi:hypothetical protein